MIEGVSLQEVAAVDGNTSEQKLELGGKPKVCNGEWESGPSHLDPSVKICRNMTAP